MSNETIAKMQAAAAAGKDKKVIVAPVAAAKTEAVKAGIAAQSVGRLPRPESAPIVHNVIDIARPVPEVPAPAPAAAPQMPSIADCTGENIVSAVVSNLARQLEYYKKLAAYWESMYNDSQV